jgi:hypothetical protein
MMRLLFVAFSFIISAGAWSQTLADAKCISIMGVPLEGPDSVFLPALEDAGFTQVQPEEPEPDTFYFEGDFYGIKSSMMVTVNEKTKLLSDAVVTCGPYRTRDLYDRNQKYLIGRLQREWGNFSAKGDGSLYMLNSYGYIRQSTGLDEEGRHAIRYYYLNTSPYYKDAANMGLKGMVQEVITENPVTENDIEHFSETGLLDNNDLIDREYDSRGYLISAAMREQNGGKSRLTYEYDSDGCLVKRTLVNATSGIRSINEYRYNTSYEIIQQSMKAFNKQNECIVSISMKNEPQERDDNDNWTVNKMQLTYWEKGQKTTIQTVEQRRTISYWDE